MSRDLDFVDGGAEPPSVIDVRAIGLALRRSRRVRLLPLLALVGIGLHLATATPRYTAEAMLRVEQARADDAVPGRRAIDPVPALRSLDLARTAIEHLHLEGDGEFDRLATGVGPFDRLLVVLGISSDPASQPAMARLVAGFERRLAVDVQPSTGQVTIAFTSRDPDLAARAANEVARLYLARAAGGDTAPPDAARFSAAAAPSRPSSPRPFALAILGTLGALALAIGWVVAAELRSGRAIVPGEGSAIPHAPDPAAGRTAEPPAAVPRRRSSDLFSEGASPLVRADPELPLFENMPVRNDMVGEDGEMVVGQRAGSGTMEMQVKRPAGARNIIASLMPSKLFSREDPVIGPAGSSPASGVGAVERLRGWASYLLSYVRDFGRSASDSRPSIAPIADQSVAPPAVRESRSAASVPEAKVPRRAGPVGWDPDGSESEPDAAAQIDAGSSRTGEAPDEIAERIVAAHVPGRGLHVVGMSIDGERACGVHIALARALSEKGRSIVVDLDTMPMKLEALVAGEEGRADIMTLPGLSELLASEAGFAEVIHRDHRSRLHFIPTGLKEADFRDFDLVLDALTETYDFIMLLTPAYPQSEIAKVMAPYADFVVLGIAETEDPMVRRFEADLVAAGARDILIVSEAESHAQNRRIA